jgi:sugar phosphate isomerase/epimerase
MKLTISNLSWNSEENLSVLNMIKKFNIKNIEISPNKVFNNNYTLRNIKKIQYFWKKQKIKFYSMQSVLFNKKNAYLFGNKTQQKIFFNEIKKKIYLSKKIGIKVIVFGSPSNKKIFSENNFDNLNNIAYNSFKKISKICKKKRICFCIEANPKLYNCEYLNYTKDAIKLVKQINSNFFKLNLDLGTIIANKESFKNIIQNNIKLIGHAQISVPYLKDIMLYKKIAVKFIRELKINNYRRYISIERLPIRNNVTNLEKTIKLLKIACN